MLRAPLSSTAAQAILYGMLLAAGAFVLSWLDFQRLAAPIPSTSS